MIRLMLELGARHLYLKISAWDMVAARATLGFFGKGLVGEPQVSVLSEVVALWRKCDWSRMCLNNRRNPMQAIGCAPSAISLFRRFGLLPNQTPAKPTFGTRSLNRTPSVTPNAAISATKGDFSTWNLSVSVHDWRHAATPAPPTVRGQTTPPRRHSRHTCRLHYSRRTIFS